MSEKRCENCPLNYYDIKKVECASQKHARYCELAEKNDKYHNKIVVESVRDHNEKVKREGMPLITWENAKNFGSAMVDWIKSNESIVPEEISQLRMTICGECESFIDGKCGLCGCLCILKTKVPTESCPIKRWGPYSSKGKNCGCGQS